MTTEQEIKGIIQKIDDIFSKVQNLHMFTSDDQRYCNKLISDLDLHVLQQDNIESQDNMNKVNITKKYSKILREKRQRFEILQDQSMDQKLGLENSEHFKEHRQQLNDAARRAEMISEKIFENNQKLQNMTGKTDILNNDLGDIDRMTNKKKFFYYISFIVLLCVMTIGMIWRFFIRQLIQNKIVFFSIIFKQFNFKKFVNKFSNVLQKLNQNITN